MNLDFIMLSFLFALLPQPAFAVPVDIAHTGRLLDAAGGAINGDHDLTVTAYDHATDSSGQLWQQSWAGVPFDNGYYTVRIGDDPANPFDGEVLQHSEIWLEHVVDGATIGPRQRFSSVPYAKVATHVLLVGAADAPTCTDPGAIVWDTSLSSLRVCDGERWNGLAAKSDLVQVDGVRRWSDGSTSAHCQAYLHPSGIYAYEGATGSGPYLIDPDGPGANDAFAVYCDMSTEEGGWTAFHRGDNTGRWSALSSHLFDNFDLPSGTTVASPTATGFHGFDPTNAGMTFTELLVIYSNVDSPSRSCLDEDVFRGPASALPGDKALIGVSTGQVIQWDDTSDTRTVTWCTNSTPTEGDSIGENGQFCAPYNYQSSWTTSASGVGICGGSNGNNQLRVQLLVR